MSSRSSALAVAVCLGLGPAETVEQACTDTPDAGPDAGPSVLIDAAHHNLIDIVEGHAGWLDEDGFRVWWQGGVLRMGRGRLAVFSDAGILATHDEAAVQEPPWNGRQLQNPQLFLNTLRWLSGEIDPDE